MFVSPSQGQIGWDAKTKCNKYAADKLYSYESAV